MMVETMFESSQDFGMSNGALPQWKRELLQRRAARTRPAAASAPPAAPPPPPPPADADDEELRYGPGIVKRLKSRYLSLALRDAPRRRPSVLRRATSLEHLLDERPPPAPRPCARAARPVSLAAPPSAAALAAGPPPRRDSVKRARSVDALSRLDARDDHPPIPPKPQPQPPPPQQQQQQQPEPPPLPPSPPPPVNRSTRPPRRPTPLLRETERPPPDVVRSALRKFESAPPRRPAPAARVSAVLRGLEALPRSSTPEPRGRSPSPAAADISAIDESEGANQSAEAKLVSRAALEGIARAGSTVRYSFEAPRHGSHLPPLAATNPVLLGRARLSASPRRVGVIRPMPSPALERSASSPTPLTDEGPEKAANESPRILTPPPVENESPPSNRPERKDPPPSAVVEPIPRSAPEETTDDSMRVESDSDASSNANNESTPEPEPKAEIKPKPEIKYDSDPPTITKTKPLMNGHAERPNNEPKTKNNLSRIGAAGIERAWTGAGDKKNIVEPKEKKDNGEVKSAVAPWVRGSGGGRQPREQPATSVVFNFSNRKEVPDYIENDGIILRANRRNRFKAGEPGIVVLRPEALAPDLDSEAEDEGDGRPPSPCGVRFVNDNVLINGRSSMPGRPNKDRISRLKLQFDDSLTRTFEYPSETSLCEESPATPTAAPAALLAAPLAAPLDAPLDAEADDADGEQARQPALLATLTSNTHIASSQLPSVLARPEVFV
ncbi:uncharacterized protein [Epargyreus clarus]|uniref:uncharacterized protein isoform X2 n=1 Tax=Epargyreus clarus TaxID=520877 RepID=UPI003C2F7A6F